MHAKAAISEVIHIQRSTIYLQVRRLRHQPNEPGRCSVTITVMFTAYRYCVGLIVPLVMSAIGVLGKKVARGPGWMWEDFYVGTELTLTGVSGALVNLYAGRL
jgi:hypothetical protein